MNKIISRMFLLALAWGLSSCNNGPSKLYQAMEEEVTTIEEKIGVSSDCDEIQMQHFAILGLCSDLDNLKKDGEMKESETIQMEEMLKHLEAFWNEKWSTLGCDKMDAAEDELDTSGEEDESSL